MVLYAQALTKQLRAAEAALKEAGVTFQPSSAKIKPARTLPLVDKENARP